MPGCVWRREEMGGDEAVETFCFLCLVKPAFDLAEIGFAAGGISAGGCALCGLSPSLFPP